MKYAIVFSAAIMVLTVLGVVGWGVRLDNTAQAQSGSSAPTNLKVANGTQPGTVIYTWTEAPGVSKHRIGWLADEDFQAYRANNA